MRSDPAVPDDAVKHKGDRETKHAITVQAVTIARPREEVFASFREFSNLGQFMENVWPAPSARVILEG